MPGKREHISRKTRFEVFKRDSFTCQYCGKKAPDVILVLDHIQPVAEGGKSDIFNLVTSCEECNSGKGARCLSDHSTIKKQRAELERLNEKRIQLEMMLEWRKGLDEIDSASEEAVVDRIDCKAAEWSVSDAGRATIRGWLRKFSVLEILEAVDPAFDQYNKSNTRESWTVAFRMVPRIAINNRKFEQDPSLRELFYIRGIIRNRCSGYFNNWQCLELLEMARGSGVPIERLREIALQVRNWTHFKNQIHELISEYEGNDA